MTSLAEVVNSYIGFLGFVMCNTTHINKVQLSVHIIVKGNYIYSGVNILTLPIHYNCYYFILIYYYRQNQGKKQSYNGAENCATLTL